MKYQTIISIFIIIFILSLLAGTHELRSETVYLIPKTDITEMIDLPYANYVKRTLIEAEEAEASTIIIELNTPGGRVDAALRITDALLTTKLKTVIFINKNAISAGALISLAAQKIFIVPGGIIGASTPVIQKGGKMEAASEKMVSVMRAEMRSSAEKYGRPTKIAAAMVDPDIELTKKKDGFELAKGKLLTLTAKEALKIKIADYPADNLEEVLKKLNLENAIIIKALPTSADRALSFLSNPYLISILLTLGLLGLIFEVKTPGWGVGGTIGVLSIALFFVIQIFSGYANWGEIALLIIGFVLIAIEVFLIPGFGLVGIGGIIALISSFIMWYSKWSKYELNAPYYILGVVAAVGFGIYFMFKYLPKSTLFNRLVLANSEVKQDGYHVSPDNLSSLDNKSGIALTTLRPAGKAEIDKQRYDVMSVGDFINKGEKIKVVQIEGNRVLVKKIS